VSAGLSIFHSGTGYKASTLMASQKVMKWLILNSDGNVAIQTFNRPHVVDPSGVAEEARLYCDKCKQFKVFDVSSFLDENVLLGELDWAKAHKHGVLTINHEVREPAVDGERKLKVVL